MNYKDILIKISKDLLLDLASLRVWLVINAFLLCYVCIFFKQDKMVTCAAIALLNLAYVFFFRSKSEEHAKDNKDDSAS